MTTHTTQTTDTSTEQLIEEAVERYKEFMTDLQINAYDHKTDKYDFSYIESSVKNFLGKELSTIASKSAEREIETTRLVFQTLLDAIESKDSRFLDEQGIYIHSYIGHDGFYYDEEALKGAKVILKYLLETLSQPKEHNVK